MSSKCPLDLGIVESFLVLHHMLSLLPCPVPRTLTMRIRVSRIITIFFLILLVTLRFVSLVEISEAHGTLLHFFSVPSAQQLSSLFSLTNLALYLVNFFLNSIVSWLFPILFYWPTTSCNSRKRFILCCS